MFGQYLDNIWAKFGQYLDNIWAIFGQYLDNIWAIFGQCFGDSLDNAWMMFHVFVVIVFVYASILANIYLIIYICIYIYIYHIFCPLTDTGDGEGGIFKKERTISKTIYFLLYYLVCIFCIFCIFSRRLACRSIRHERTAQRASSLRQTPSERHERQRK